MVGHAVYVPIQGNLLYEHVSLRISFAVASPPFLSVKSPLLDVIDSICPVWCFWIHVIIELSQYDVLDFFSDECGTAIVT